MRRIYLDNAATSWPKPERVYRAVETYMRACGAPAGRSAYREAGEAAQLVERTREKVASLLDAPDARNVVFTLNGTDALNIAIHGLARPGDHIVTSQAEHNSVLRPVRWLEESEGINVTRVPCDQEGLIDVEQVIAALRAETRLVVLTHASNVTGGLQDIRSVGQAVRNHGAMLLVDAAQTAGHFSFGVNELSADLLAASGHKGLLGPLGTGILWVGPRAEQIITSLRQGGTGTESQADQHPTSLPERLEAGNLNVCGLAGLSAGIDFLKEQGLDSLRQHELSLTDQLLLGLRSIDQVRIIGGNSAETRVGVVSICIDGYDSQEVAAALDSGYGIQVRSGFHCAPLMHRCMDTEASGGTVRFSLGPFNNADEIDLVVEAVGEISSAALTH